MLSWNLILLIGGLWRKFPSEQTKENKYEAIESRNEKFRKNKLVFWFDVVAGYRSNTRNQTLEGKFQHKKKNNKKVN